MQALLVIAFIVVVVLVILIVMRRRRRARYMGGDEENANTDYPVLPGEEFEGGYGDEDEFVGGGPFRLKVADPWYEAMHRGKKTVEGRLDRPPFSRLKKGDPVLVVRSRPQGDTSEYAGGPYKYPTEVVRVTKYPNYTALLSAEGPDKVYPGKKTAEAAAEEFKKHLRDPKDISAPALALELKPPPKG